MSTRAHKLRHSRIAAAADGALPGCASGSTPRFLVTAEDERSHDNRGSTHDNGGTIDDRTPGGADTTFRNVAPGRVARERRRRCERPLYVIAGYDATRTAQPPSSCPTVPPGAPDRTCPCRSTIPASPRSETPSMSPVASHPTVRAGARSSSNRARPAGARSPHSTAPAVLCHCWQSAAGSTRLAAGTARLKSRLPNASTHSRASGPISPPCPTPATTPAASSTPVEPVLPAAEPRSPATRSIATTRRPTRGPG